MWKQGLAVAVSAAALSGCSVASSLEEVPGYEDAHSDAASYCAGHLAVYRVDCVETETRRILVQSGHREAEDLPWEKAW